MKTANLQKDICRNINALLESEMKNNELLIEYLEHGFVHSFEKNRKFAPKIGTGDIVSVSCISEAIATYNANDNNLNENSSEKGQLLYSPRIDICITPIVTSSNSNKRQQAFNKLINIERNSYYKMVIYNCPKVRRLIREIKSVAINNYKKRFGLVITPKNNPSKNPLHLLGLELEMNPNLKHLMGDFVNAYILSKYPVVVIKDEIFDKAMKMLHYMKVTNEQKNHQLNQLLCVSPLKLSQFIQIVNDATEPYNVRPIILSHYL